jgi:Ca2+-binding EF-hand superfamily protein
MKPKLTLLTALAFASVTGVATAQDAPPPPTRPGRTLPEALKPFDVNSDGRLSREEYKAYLDEHRPETPKSQWDTNGDGKLDAAEIEAARAAMRERLLEKFRVRFDEADTEGGTEENPGDDSLTLEEFKATLPEDISDERAAAAFARLESDDDQDEVLSLEEFLKFNGLPVRPDAVHKPKPKPETPKPKPPQRPPLSDLLKEFDTNNDGILSRAEIQAAIEAGKWPVRPKPPTDGGGDDDEDDGDDDGDDTDGGEEPPPPPPVDPEQPPTDGGTTGGQ